MGPLEESNFNMNMDGALFDNLRVKGVGIVLRDNKGCVIMATSLQEHMELIP